MKSTISEYTRLYVSGQDSFFQSSNGMRRDSILVNEPDNRSKLSANFTNIAYSIQITGNKLTYNEKLINKKYQYSEVVNFNWNIKSNKKRIISGYSCANATTYYGGRAWSVWFTSEIPLNAGPYKFRGLPGLILEAEDATGSYKFIFHKFLDINFIKDPKLSRYHNTESLDNRIMISREEFNKVNLKVKNFSEQEQLDFMMTDNNGVSTGKIIVFENGIESGAKLRDLDKAKKDKANTANPIELSN